MLYVFILALVQSITEFLPISSTAHLILVPQVMGGRDLGLSMDVGLHVGTLFAVLIYFGRDFWSLLKSFYRKGSEQDLCLKLIVGTIPVLMIGFFLERWVETVFRSPLVIAVMLIVFGLILYVADKWGKNTKDINSMSFKDALGIGLAQCIALVPGTSRSGVTMTAARLCGIQRSDAAKFCMMLSVPAIAAAAVFHFGQIVISGDVSTVFTVPFFAGIAFSLIGGLLAVTFLMRWVKTHSFAVFTIYRLVLGAYLLYAFL